MNCVLNIYIFVYGRQWELNMRFSIVFPVLRQREKKEIHFNFFAVPWSRRVFHFSFLLFFFDWFCQRNDDTEFLLRKVSADFFPFLSPPPTPSSPSHFLLAPFLPPPSSSPQPLKKFSKDLFFFSYVCILYDVAHFLLR